MNGVREEMNVPYFVHISIQGFPFTYLYGVTNDVYFIELLFADSDGLVLVYSEPWM